MPASQSVKHLYDTPRGRRIYHWLRRQPPLARVVGTDEDDEEVTVSLERTGGAGIPKWKDAIVALYDCTKLRGLNDKGEVLRLLSLDPQADPVLQQQSDRRDDEIIARREAKEHGSTLIAVDVPRLVDSIAKNMQEVAKSSAEQQATAFAAGFTAMTNVVNLCIGLLQRVDQRLESLEQATDAPPEEPPPADEGADRNELAHVALARALGMGVPGAAPGAVNPEQAAQLAQLLRQYLGGQQPPTAEPNGHAQ